jgi:hypothetical protein
MRVAIDAELPLTRHRWCKWHVLRKAKESLGPVYSKNSPFKRDLHELLDIIVDVEEFETRWSELITGYSLQDNEFLSRAYDNREMWAKPYFTSTFCAGMTSTQRSESANHVLKTYIPRSAPMHLFVTQYDRLITDRIAEEGREQHATKQVFFFLIMYSIYKLPDGCLTPLLKKTGELSTSGGSADREAWNTCVHSHDVRTFLP